MVSLFITMADGQQVFWSLQDMLLYVTAIAEKNFILIGDGTAIGMTILGLIVFAQILKNITRILLVQYLIYIRKQSLICAT